MNLLSWISLTVSCLSLATSVWVVLSTLEMERRLDALEDKEDDAYVSLKKMEDNK